MNKPTLVVDTYAGLCNQKFDIQSSIAFATKHNYNFCFRYCSLRYDNLTSYYQVDFGHLFDRSVFQNISGHVEFKTIDLNDGPIWNSAGKRAVELIKSCNEIHEIAESHSFIILKQFWPIFNWNEVKSNYIQIKPSPHIYNKFLEIKENLPEKFNFLHFRYEHDFVNFFSKSNLITHFPHLHDILTADLFEDNTLPLYVAASNVQLIFSNLPSEKSKNIIFTDEKKIIEFNFEESAYLDFLVANFSEQVFGHSRSSFSVAINKQKRTSNYYDLTLNHNP